MFGETPHAGRENILAEVVHTMIQNYADPVCPRRFFPDTDEVKQPGVIDEQRKGGFEGIPEAVVNGPGKAAPILQLTPLGPGGRCFGL